MFWFIFKLSHAHIRSTCFNLHEPDEVTNGTVSIFIMYSLSKVLENNEYYFKKYDFQIYIFYIIDIKNIQEHFHRKCKQISIKLFIWGRRSWIWVNTDSGTKPSPKPILTYHQRYSVAFTWEQFHKSAHELNTLGPSDAKWRQKTGSALAQVMACCLMAPSHYLNQCWLIISKV